MDDTPTTAEDSDRFSESTNLNHTTDSSFYRHQTGGYP